MHPCTNTSRFLGACTVIVVAAVSSASPWIPSGPTCPHLLTSPPAPPSVWINKPASGTGGSYFGPSDTVPMEISVPNGAFSVSTFLLPCTQQVPAFGATIAWPAAPPSFKGKWAMVAPITLGQIRTACAGGQDPNPNFCVQPGCSLGIDEIFVFSNIPLPGSTTKPTIDIQGGCLLHPQININVACFDYGPYLQPVNDNVTALVVLVRCCPPPPQPPPPPPPPLPCDIIGVPVPPEFGTPKETPPAP